MVFAEVIYLICCIRAGMFYRKTSPCHGNPCRIFQKKLNDKFSKILVGFLVFRMEIVAWLSVNTAKTQNVFLFFSKMEKILNHMGNTNQVK